MRDRPRHVPAAPLRELSRRLEGVGDSDDPDAARIYEAVVRRLLLPRAYDEGFAAAVEALPEDRGGLLRVAGAVEAFVTVTGRDAKEGASSDLAGVVGTMAKVPDPEPYVRRLHDQGFLFVTAIFAPGTFRRAKKDTAVRGALKGTSDYWARTKHQLDIVTD